MVYPRWLSTSYEATATVTVTVSSVEAIKWPLPAGSTHRLPLRGTPTSLTHRYHGSARQHTLACHYLYTAIYSLLPPSHSKNGDGATSLLLLMLQIRECTTRCVGDVQMCKTFRLSQPNPTGTVHNRLISTGSLHSQRYRLTSDLAVDVYTGTMAGNSNAPGEGQERSQRLRNSGLRDRAASRKLVPRCFLFHGLPRSGKGGGELCIPKYNRN
ncbi:hypothetical protein J6590_044768 [Homalodisca vitripennis]|nr:hypothetical protein J6590_044768 [Homalodisca vitripennis]